MHVDNTKNVTILGSTGSIGTQTLDVIGQQRKYFNVVGLACKDELEKLKEQIKHFHPKIVSVYNEETAKNLERMLDDVENKPEIVYGKQGLIDVATIDEADVLVGALVGFIGLVPVLEAIKAGKDIALANKETLIAAGHLVMDAVKKNRVKLTPIDSEHSALFQCLNGERIDEVRRLIITASGGPFKFKKRHELENVTVEQALGHPTWKMGPKITIDSATLMNKGLEIIEAHWLFDMPYEKITAVMHPQSIIHSLVEFVDGSIICQIGTHDMRFPIQYALSHPKRIPNNMEKLDLLKTRLEFYPLDTETFPCIEYAREAGVTGGSMPALMNAANEEAVNAFLNKEIKFLDIPLIVRKSMDKHKTIKNPSLDEILEVDKKGREEARKIINELKEK